MDNKPSLTRDCIEPWKSLFFRPDGKILPCCGAPPPEGDFGNIYDIDFHSSDDDSAKAVFANEAYKNLRRQLLEGTPSQACKGCRVVGADVPTDVLRRKVVDHLRYGGRNVSESTDLSQEYCFTDCFTDVTDKCNFACIYCFVHSNDRSGDVPPDYIEVERERFLDIVSFLAANGLEFLNFCWTGEPTIYPQWKELCLELFDKFPKVRLSMVSNFGRKFTDADLDVLTRFFQIRISCDTLDPEKYSWLRRGGRLSVLMENIDNLRARFKPGSVHPKLVFIVTESDAILSGLTGLARFAVARNISLYMSNMAIIEDSVAAKTNCLKRIVDLPDTQLLEAWEIIHDLPRRARAENPPIDFFCDLGPLYITVRQRAESITLNRFVPSENETVYKSFAAAQPKNPDAYLRKFFLSFDDCVKGVYIKSGMTVDIDLPYPAGVLQYRPVLCKEITGKSLHIFTGNSVTSMVGQKLAFSSVKCPGRFTHVLFEVLSYEPCGEDQSDTEILDSLGKIPLFPQLVAIGEFPDRRFELAMAVSDFLKAYPRIHKFAEGVYRWGLRLLSRRREG